MQEDGELVVSLVSSVHESPVFPVKQSLAVEAELDLILVGEVNLGWIGRCVECELKQPGVLDGPPACSAC